MQRVQDADRGRTTGGAAAVPHEQVWTRATGADGERDG